LVQGKEVGTVEVGKTFGWLLAMLLAPIFLVASNLGSSLAA
jgi:hypothetical protein